MVKKPPANAGDARDSSSIPGSGRCPGGRHSHPLQCSCLENPMDRGACWATVHGVAKTWKRLTRQRARTVLQPVSSEQEERSHLWKFALKGSYVGDFLWCLLWTSLTLCFRVKFGEWNVLEFLVCEQVVELPQFTKVSKDFRVLSLQLQMHGWANRSSRWGYRYCVCLASFLSLLRSYPGSASGSSSKEQD